MEPLALGQDRAGMRIAITSGTGFVGRRVAARLEAGGHEAVIVSRRTGISITDKRPGGAEPTGLTAAFQDCDAVIHCAGINREIGAQTYQAVHIEGTQAVVDAARSAGVQRIVSTGACGGDDVAVGRAQEAGSTSTATRAALTVAKSGSRGSMSNSQVAIVSGPPTVVNVYTISWPSKFVGHSPVNGRPLMIPKSVVATSVLRVPISSDGTVPTTFGGLSAERT